VLGKLHRSLLWGFAQYCLEATHGVSASNSRLDEKRSLARYIKANDPLWKCGTEPLLLHVDAPRGYERKESKCTTSKHGKSFSRLYTVWLCLMPYWTSLSVHTAHWLARLQYTTVVYARATSVVPRNRPSNTRDTHAAPLCSQAAPRLPARYSGPKHAMYTRLCLAAARRAAASAARCGYTCISP
jgi:hypothetical protein